MFQGKMKAVTFSYDDGVVQDRRLIPLLNKYNLKATFNLNSGRFGEAKMLQMGDKEMLWKKVEAEEVKELYRGHEVAAHTINHKRLTEMTDEEVIYQVEEDRLRLSELVGYEVKGMAYPCGGVNNDDRVAQLIKDHTGVKYARTIKSSNSMDLQDNIYRFNPTIYHLSFDQAFQFGQELIDAKPEKPMLLYLWGHGYEFDLEDAWEKFEQFCEFISGHDDIFYGTNKDVFDM